MIPRLNTVQLNPELQRPVTQAFTSLNRIERIEINRVDVVDGAVYFVVEIYCQGRESHIPTIAQRKDIVQQSLWTVQERPSRSYNRRNHSHAPDYTIRRSFAAFQHFQSQLHAHLEHENRGNCHSCNAWMTFTEFAMVKSKLKISVFPLRAIRKRELSKLLNAAVVLAIQATIPVATRRQCQVSDAMALHVSTFLQEGTATF